MENIVKYINEKLNLSSGAHPEDWFQIDIADEIDMPDWAYDYRKLKNGSKNRLWYAVYCYLYKNGPTKVVDILSELEKSSSYGGRFFSELRNYHVISAGTGKFRGLQFPEDPDEWIDFTDNAWIQ